MTTDTAADATTDTDTDTAEWEVWSTTARIVVTEPAALAAARAVVEQVLAEVDLAASRFRPDSEISRLAAADGRPQQVSPLLAELVGAALTAARETDGDVDPTLADSLVANGYDRDIDQLARVSPAAPSPAAVPSATAVTVPAATPARRGGVLVSVVRRPRPDWRQVRLDGTTLTLPAGVGLDLGATAKAFAADRAARLVARTCGTGVLVSLGGDIATAGPGPEGGWRIRVQDGDDEPGCTIALPAGSALATSSTIRRRWVHHGRLVHHVLDPRTGFPADPVWRTVTVAAPTCLQANTLTTAALVRGLPARSWLRGLGAPARLVARDGELVTLGGWPRD